MSDTDAHRADEVAERGAATARAQETTHHPAWSSQTLVGGNGFPTLCTDHQSIAYGCFYSNQADATQMMHVTSNNAWGGYPPSPYVDQNYSHHLNFGGGAYNHWQNPQQQGAYVGNYGTPYLQPQPQALPLYSAMEPPAFGRSMDFPGNCCPSPQIPSGSKMQQQQQPARSHSSSPRLVPYGEYIPLRLRVRDLEEDQRLKALVNERVLKPHYVDMPVASQRDTARPKTDLFVFHVPKGMTEGELYNLFARHGKLRRVRIQFNVDKDTNETKGYAFVTFKDLSDAVVAVHRLDGYPVRKNKALSVTYCKDKDQPARRSRPAKKSAANRRSSV